MDINLNLLETTWIQKKIWIQICKYLESNDSIMSLGVGGALWK